MIEFLSSINPISTILFFTLLIFFLTIFFIFILRNSSKIQNRELELQIIKTDDLLNKNDELLKAYKLLENQNIDLKIENSSLKTNVDLEIKNKQTIKDDFEEQSKKLELKLNEIMQNSLEKRLEKFDENSVKTLDNVLKPFKENLEGFKKKVEENQESSIKKFAELSKEIEFVSLAGLNISKEAQNLTQALKGKKQTQGSWGEMILESVLEYSGLLKNIHYFTQESYKDEQGKIKRPDVIIKLPQNRSMIIDSKVSLVDYDEYIRAETNEQREISLNNIVNSFKNHIDTLDSKDYAHYKMGTLQYVFMFIPIEGAFSLAVQKDPTLYEYALKKHIAIVNPSTLTISLRTIYLYWQSEQSSTMATKLFDEAGKLYDKILGFSDNFYKIKNQLLTLSNTYETASKQLSEGNGNILNRVENLKKLGAKTTKTLKDSKIEFEDFDDVEAEVYLLNQNEKKD
ncbi:DNA recombination protein RmuC [Aliarcobacter thereius]|uniref:DNA recombination protein RmuC n=2 Tax=Aliarcobacter thereius TaxID=544718 RepID=A0A1C0B6C2_9BACT|nr:DNA recombination protein RmuC [Aliarcobacter thereius]OCL86434.1 DNA recombination protein RmuC [Aliarcobacter thereius]OCL90118.1 DNA recombination protein RmuC [Aliarcobacter thereius]OCL96282.1 DNA recombination protein RmuC [Aliarcobacter thereius LMG 24486]OCL98858.1 DNA recombination protein RmuC [Aliarcobacter thereius]QBF15755.1 DNA recombination protein [Aliarcobacter thereius LMG 24486]